MDQVIHLSASLEYSNIYTLTILLESVNLFISPNMLAL